MPLFRPKPKLIEYDRFNAKMVLTYEDGTLVAFSATESNFKDFTRYEFWKTYKLPRKIKRKISQCLHDMEQNWVNKQGAGYEYCSCCNHVIKIQP